MDTKDQKYSVEIFIHSYFNHIKEIVEYLKEYLPFLKTCKIETRSSEKRYHFYITKYENFSGISQLDILELLMHKLHNSIYSSFWVMSSNPSEESVKIDEVIDKLDEKENDFRRFCPEIIGDYERLDKRKEILKTVYEREHYSEDYIWMKIGYLEAISFHADKFIKMLKGENLLYPRRKSNSGKITLQYFNSFVYSIDFLDSNLKEKKEIGDECI